MDLFSHAAVGVATGQIFGHPILGGLFAVLPDFALGLKRRQSPNLGYRYGHSLLAPCIAALLAVALGLGGAVAETVGFCLLSHIVLDIPTHGNIWAPKLLFPFKDWSFKGFSEWEFFSFSWYVGLTITTGWIVCALFLT